MKNYSVTRVSPAYPCDSPGPLIEASPFSQSGDNEWFQFVAFVLLFVAFVIEFKLV